MMEVHDDDDNNNAGRDYDETINKNMQCDPCYAFILLSCFGRDSLPPVSQV